MSDQNVISDTLNLGDYLSNFIKTSVQDIIFFSIWIMKASQKKPIYQKYEICRTLGDENTHLLLETQGIQIETTRSAFTLGVILIIRYTNKEIEWKNVNSSFQPFYDDFPFWRCYENFGIAYIYWLRVQVTQHTIETLKSINKKSYDLIMSLMLYFLIRIFYNFVTIEFIYFLYFVFFWKGNTSF